MATVDDFVLTDELSSIMKTAEDALDALEKEHIQKIDVAYEDFAKNLSVLLKERQPHMDKRTDLWAAVMNSAAGPIKELLQPLDQKLSRAVLSLRVVTAPENPKRTRISLTLKQNPFTAAGEVAIDVDDTDAVSVITPIAWTISENARKGCFFEVFSGGASDDLAKEAVDALKEVFLNPLVFLEDS